MIRDHNDHMRTACGDRIQSARISVHVSLPSSLLPHHTHHPFNRSKGRKKPKPKPMTSTPRDSVRPARDGVVVATPHDHDTEAALAAKTPVELDERLGSFDDLSVRDQPERASGSGLGEGRLLWPHRGVGASETFTAAAATAAAPGQGLRVTLPVAQSFAASTNSAIFSPASTDSTTSRAHEGTCEQQRTPPTTKMLHPHGVSLVINDHDNEWPLAAQPKYADERGNLLPEPAEPQWGPTMLIVTPAALRSDAMSISSGSVVSTHIFNPTTLGANNAERSPGHSPHGGDGSPVEARRFVSDRKR